MTVKSNVPARDKKTASSLWRDVVGIGIDEMAPVIAAVKERRSKKIARALEAAEEISKNAEPVKARLKHAREEREKRKTEQDRQVKERLDAIQPEIEKQAARMVQEQADNKRRAEAREKQRKAEAKVFEETRQERASSLEMQRQAKADAVKRSEAQRQGRVKAVIGNIDRLLPDDALRAFSKDKPTDAEKSLLRESLEALQRRCEFQIHSLTRVLSCTPTQVDSLAKGHR